MNASNDITRKTNNGLELNMTRLINDRLQQNTCIIPRTVSAHPAELSQRLAKLLALSAPKGKNVDKKVLMSNLQSAIEKRRASKKQAPQPKKNNRRQRLIEVVGAARAQQIIVLIREIRVLRLRRRDLIGVEATCNQPQMICTGGSCSANLYTLKPKSGKVSKEVRDLFFNTAIVDALEKGSPSGFDKLPWDQLYAQGRQHAQAYRAWLQQQEAVVQQA